LSFRQVAASPYAWPFDGAWSAADTALLAIDLQLWLMRALARQDVEEAATQLIEAARRAAVPVLFTARLGFDDHRPIDPALVDSRPPASGEARAILPALEPPSTFDVIERRGWSAFTGTALDQMLRARGVRNLIFCGATTDGAVHTTMREANDRGYECLLVENACCAQVAAHHEAILRITRFGNGLFGTTARVAAIVNVLEGNAQ